MLASSLEFAGTGRFEVRSRLGQGAVGVVYEAFDRESLARVALKTLRHVSPETILLLKSEFRAVQDLQHPNLVQFGELFEDQGRWFFTMEFVQGVDFLRYVRPDDNRVTPLVPALRDVSRPPSARYDEARLRDALVQLGRGLRVLHEAEKIHCDVKPSNVMVTDEGRVVLLDFGITSDLKRRQVEEQGPMGTVAYMAPEQIASEPLGPATDWYAVGVVLYEALTGRLPFEGAMYDTMDEKLHREPPPPHTLVPNVPRDLDELCIDLLRIDPAQRPSGVDVLKRLHADDAIDERMVSGQRGVFIGRREELRTLEEAFEDARKSAVTVFVRGESGVGKSFLVRTFTEGLQNGDASLELFAGRCYERESVPYKAVDGIVDDVMRLLARLPDEEVEALLPEHIGLLGHVFPVLAQIPLVAQAVASSQTILNPQELRTRVFAALRQLLVNVAERQPTVLLVDDLQWADADSMALLADVMRPPDAPRLLLLATMRAVTQSLQRVKTAQLGATRIIGDVRHVVLDKLPPDDARALIAQLLGADADDEQLRAIAEDAKGHPLFIDELVRQQSRRGTDGAPLLLDDALWGRVSQLEPEARRLLELVCIAGVPIAQETAAHAAALDVAQLLHQVSTLRTAHFARTSGMRRDDMIEPYHDRVRATVLNRLEPGVRKDWHGRLALALEGAKQADLETLAIHWHGAENFERAGDYAVRAADEAATALAFNRAVRLYRLGLELLEPRGAAERAIKTKLAEALTNAGRGAEAAEARLALAEGAEPIDALDQRRRAAEQLLCSGRFDQGVEILRLALAKWGVAFPRSPIGVIVSLIFFRIWLRLRGIRFTARDSSAIERADLVRIDTVRSAGAGFSMNDNIRGAYFQTRALILALRAGDIHRIARALCMEVCFTAVGGGASRARTNHLIKELDAVVAQAGTPEAAALRAAALGYASYFVGDWRESRDQLALSEELLRDRCIGVTFELNSVRTMLYRVLAYLGDLRGLAERVPPAFREVEEQGDRYSSITLRASPMAILGLAADDPTRVRAEVQQAREWLPSGRFLLQNYYSMIADSQVDLYRGDAVAALEQVTSKWPALKKSMLLRVQSLRIAVLEQRARAAVAASYVPGQPRDALLALADRDRAAIAGDNHPRGRALAMMLGASIAAARGDVAAAKAQAVEAVRLFEEAYMALHATAARMFHGQLLGDDATVAAAEVWMTDQAIKSPRRMALLYVVSPPAAPAASSRLR
jgi:hypothetical protein